MDGSSEGLGVMVGLKVGSNVGAGDIVGATVGYLERVGTDVVSFEFCCIGAEVVGNRGAEVVVC